MRFLKAFDEENTWAFLPFHNDNFSQDAISN
jgi:hypothetical protein